MARHNYGRRSVETSNEDKVLFPVAAITKGDLIEYYERIAEHILPHLADRPLVLQRFPDGIGGEGFYQKQAGSYFPDWIATVRVAVRTSDQHQDLVACADRATLVYLANQACIALHPWLSRRDAIDRPDLLAIDLAPPEDDFEAVRIAALRVRDLLDELELPSFPKLTGSRGMHVVVPLDRSAGFDAVRAFAQEAMELLARRYPHDLTTEQRTDRREGRLYLDVGRNAYAQTAVAPWSVRPLPSAPVAAPLRWRDVEQKGLGPRDFGIKNVFRSLSQRADPWRGIGRRAHALAPAGERLAKLGERERGRG